MAKKVSLGKDREAELKEQKNKMSNDVFEKLDYRFVDELLMKKEFKSLI